MTIEMVLQNLQIPDTELLLIQVLVSTIVRLSLEKQDKAGDQAKHFIICGVVKNFIDHPHEGGEGHLKEGKPWGKPPTKARFLAIVGMKKIWNLVYAMIVYMEE